MDLSQARLAEGIEFALFGALGTSASQYKARVRSIVFNLRTPGSDLTRRLQQGSLKVDDLALCAAELLAPEHVQASRRAAREKYFREQVH
eukprot:948757-Amphidinium_carterae.1